MLSPNKTASRFSVSRICWRRESTEALTLYQLASDCDTAASLYRPAAISAHGLDVLLPVGGRLFGDLQLLVEHGQRIIIGSDAGDDLRLHCLSVGVTGHE